MKFLVLLLIPILSSCSLQPVHKDCIECYALTVKVAPSGYLSYKLSKLLESKKAMIERYLNQNATLSVSLSEEFGTIAMTEAGLSARAHGSIVVDISFSEKGKGVKTNRLDCVSSYNINDGDPYMNDQAKSFVRERLLNNLSDQIIRKVIQMKES